MIVGCSGSPMTKAQYQGRKVCGRASPPHDAPTGPCRYSWETPFGTFDCYQEDRLIGWEPLWYQGQVYLDKSRCNCEGDMTKCKYFKEVTE